MSVNVLYINDEVEVTIFPPSLGNPVWIPAVIKGFFGKYVYVVAKDQSKDPLVENDWKLPWSHVRRKI